MKTIKGFKEIIDKYDIFILDQWGVMHNGEIGFQHAYKCIDILKKNKKIIIIISNSSKRKISSLNTLPLLGFNPNLIDGLITSGEMIWNTINFSIDSFGNNFNKCFHIFDKSKEDGLDFRKGLDKLEFVSSISEAEFILACTPFKNSKPIDYLPILNEAYEKNMPMFCANPDYETIDGNSNKKTFCMGTIAELYKEIGGKVIIKGKPSIEIYKEALKYIKGVNKNKIVAVGDSLFHDISGANKFGIDNILITSGIHNDSFSKQKPIWKTNKNKLLKYNIEPTYLCSKFSF